MPAILPGFSRFAPYVKQTEYVAPLIQRRYDVISAEYAFPRHAYRESAGKRVVDAHYTIFVACGDFAYPTRRASLGDRHGVIFSDKAPLAAAFLQFTVFIYGIVYVKRAAADHFEFVHIGTFAVERYVFHRHVATVPNCRVARTAAQHKARPAALDRKIGDVFHIYTGAVKVLSFTAFPFVVANGFGDKHALFRQFVRVDIIYSLLKNQLFFALFPCQFLHE